MDSTADIPRIPQVTAAAGPTATSEQTARAPTPSPGIFQTVICPAERWQLINVAELWHHRELLFFLTWRDVKVRYKQTVLGAAWAILQPAMMMIVFTMFFNRMGKAVNGDLPYPIFAFAGLLPWTFFATSIANAGVSVIASERLISKIYFPRLAVPLAAVGAAIVDFVIALGMLVLMILFYRIKGTPIHVGPGLLMAPVVFALIVLCAIGVSTMLAALTVAYRDFRYVIPFLVQVWLFATPTVYMQVLKGETGEKMQAALMINPMASLVASFRSAMFGEPLPWKYLAVSGLAAILLVLVGCLYFRKVEDSFADLI